MTGGGASPRILLLCGYGGPYGGSFVPMLRAIVAEARSRGFEAECGFTPIARDREWLADLAADGIEVSFAPSDDRDDLRDWVGARLAELPGPALIHTHFTAFEVPAVRAASAAASSPPVVWHVHSHQPRGVALVAKAVFKYAWLGRRVAAIACVSEAIRAAVGRRGAPPRKLVVVPGGIDVDRFTPIAAEERRDARAALGIDTEGHLLLHIGWHWEAKGGPLFAATLAAVRAAGVDAVGVSVGGGARAAEAAAELGLEGALLAADPTPDVRRLYALADVLLSTSHGEGGNPPFAVLEALSCGLAVVATDVPGHRVEGSRPTALRLARSDPGALAEATVSATALSPSALADERREAGEWVAANRSLALTARRVADLYDAALGPR